MAKRSIAELERLATEVVLDMLAHASPQRDRVRCLGRWWCIRLTVGQPGVQWISQGPVAQPLVPASVPVRSVAPGAPLETSVYLEPGVGIEPTTT